MNLRAAFPAADCVSTDARRFGFKRGVVVRNGDRTHAISLEGRSMAQAIQALKQWGAR